MLSGRAVRVSRPPETAALPGWSNSSCWLSGLPVPNGALHHSASALDRYDHREVSTAVPANSSPNAWVHVPGAGGGDVVCGGVVCGGVVGGGVVGGGVVCDVPSAYAAYAAYASVGLAEVKPAPPGWNTRTRNVVEVYESASTCPAIFDPLIGATAVTTTAVGAAPSRCGTVAYAFASVVTVIVRWST